MNDGSTRFKLKGMKRAFTAYGSALATLLAGLLSLLAVLGTSVGPARAAFPGHDGKIAFFHKDAIYTMRDDGSHKQRLASGFPSKPSFSPNGRKIVFSRYQRCRDVCSRRVDIWTMRADGSHQRRLTHGFSDYDASFSPTGRRILFSRSGANGAAHLYTMRRDGSHQSRLHHDDRGFEVEAEYSPNGRHIVFQWDYCRIRLIRADGSHARTIDADATSSDCDEAPDFSPNGKRIIFDRENTDLLGADQILVVRTNGSHARQLTHDPECNYEFPVFSPRGGQIAFASNRPACNSAATDIYVMRADGSHVHRLTRHRVRLLPSWGVRP